MFATTEYYGDMQELNKFYNDNYDKLVVVDEYGKEHDFKRLMLSCIMRDKNNELKYNEFYARIDNYGNWWVDREFW